MLQYIYKGWHKKILHMLLMFGALEEHIVQEHGRSGGSVEVQSRSGSERAVA